MRLVPMLHWNTCLILPSLVFMEHRCENEQCNELHGWSLELGWLWGSIALEYTIPNADGTP